MRKKKIKVSDSWQKNYSYELSESAGKNFDPDFRPELTPKQMLALGVFNGNYFADKPKEFPNDWWAKARISKEPDSKLNFFKINASQSYEVWKRKGWIYKDDPRGWFQWYCRYYLGRRIPKEDARQIKRWKMIKRHVAQVEKNCMQMDWSCRRRQRQALLHWAYDSRKI